MKSALTLLAALGLLATLGCEEPADDDVNAYDQEIDSPVCMYVPAGDADIIVDQAELARRAAARAATASTPSTPTSTGTSARPTASTLPPGMDAMTSARKRIKDVGDAVLAGQPDQVVGLFAADDAAALAKLMAAGDLQGRANATVQVVRAKFGDNAASQLTQMTRVSGPPAINAMAPTAQDLYAGFLDLGSATLRAEGDSVVVTKSDGRQAKMVYTDNGWKFDLGDEDKRIFQGMADLTDGAGAFLDALTKAVNDGTLAAPDFDIAVKQFFDQHIKPALDKAGLKAEAPAATTPKIPPTTPPRVPPTIPPDGF